MTNLWIFVPVQILIRSDRRAGIACAGINIPCGKATRENGAAFPQSGKSLICVQGVSFLLHCNRAIAVVTSIPPLPAIYMYM